MRQDIKDQWVAALRSGDYKQGRGALHDTVSDEYCCLGVLCDLAVKAGVTTRTVESHLGLDQKLRSWFDEQSSVLPRRVKLWAGLIGVPDVFTGGEKRGLASINDRGAPFGYIADLIEEQL